MNDWQDTILAMGFVILGILTWGAGNVLGDRQGGTNMGLILVGGGVGYATKANKIAKQDNVKTQYNIQENDDQPLITGK